MDQQVDLNKLWVLHLGFKMSKGLGLKIGGMMIGGMCISSPPRCSYHFCSITTWIPMLKYRRGQDQLTYNIARSKNNGESDL
jgi:hypothetical protein